MHVQEAIRAAADSPILVDLHVGQYRTYRQTALCRAGIA